MATTNFSATRALLSILVCCAALTACGGGGGDDNDHLDPQVSTADKVREPITDVPRTAAPAASAPSRVLTKP